MSSGFPAGICSVVLLVSASSHLQAAGFELFNDNVVQSISLQMAGADWASLQQHYLDNTYYHAQLSWNGTSIDVGIHSRGASSRSPDKPNFDINVDKYVKHQSIDGISYFTLKANNQDPSNLHEVLAFKFFQKMGIPAPRTAPSQVYLNGQILGFYFVTEHEDEDEDFVAQVFGENTGYLCEWEPDYSRAYHFDWLGSDPNLYASFLDLKTDQDAPDLQTFTNWVAAANSTAADKDYLANTRSTSILRSSWNMLRSRT
jgi:spore coat protein H